MGSFVWYWLFFGIQDCSHPHRMTGPLACRRNSETLVKDGCSFWSTGVMEEDIPSPFLVTLGAFWRKLCIKYLLQRAESGAFGFHWPRCGCFQDSRYTGVQISKYWHICSPERQGNISFHFSSWESHSLPQLNIFLSTVWAWGQRTQFIMISQVATNYVGPL